MAHANPPAAAPDTRKPDAKGKPRAPRKAKAAKSKPAAAVKSDPKTGAAMRFAAVADLHELEGNARTHPPEQLEALARSIREFGFNAPLLVDKHGTVVAGHARLEVARRLGLERVPYVQLDHLTPAKARAYAIADNRIAELAEWDDELLARELHALEAAGLELPAVGFTDRELAALDRELAPPPEISAEEDEAGPKVIDTGPPVSRKGDLWTFGRHRYLVADCRSSDDVKRLCEGKTPDLLVSDPPYCSGGYQEAGRHAGSWGTIAADNLSSRGYAALLTAALGATTPTAVYLFTDWRMWIELHAVVESSGLAVRSMLVWDKGTPALGALWRTQHELVMFAARGRQLRKKGIAALGNVLRFPRTGNGLHYTEKPVALIEAILRGNSVSSSSTRVLDVFAGSAPVISAAERAEFTAYCLDVEPKCADAAITRWRREGKPEPWLDVDGRPTWSEVAKSRGVEIAPPE